MTGKVCSPIGDRHTDVVLKELSCHPTRLQLRRDSAGMFGQKNGGLLECLKMRKLRLGLNNRTNPAKETELDEGHF